MDVTDLLLTTGVLTAVAAFAGYTMWRGATPASKHWRDSGGGFGVIDEVFFAGQHQARQEQEREAEIGDVMPEGAEPQRDDLDAGVIVLTLPDAAEAATDRTSSPALETQHGIDGTAGSRGAE